MPAPQDDPSFVGLSDKLRLSLRNVVAAGHFAQVIAGDLARCHRETEELLPLLEKLDIPKLC